MPNVTSSITTQSANVWSISLVTHLLDAQESQLKKLTLANLTLVEPTPVPVFQELDACALATLNTQVTRTQGADPNASTTTTAPTPRLASGTSASIPALGFAARMPNVALSTTIQSVPAFRTTLEIPLFAAIHLHGLNAPLILNAPSTLHAFKRNVRTLVLQLHVV
jgi:hypothetical protein